MFAGSGLAETSAEKSYPGDKIKNLVLENGSGNLDIASHQGSDVTVTIEKRDYSEKNCKLTMKQDGAELLLKVEQIDEGFFNGDCEVDFQVRVPQASTLNYALNLGAGNVTLNDIKGELSFNLGAGDLKANGIAVASLSGKSGAGNVDVKGTVEEGDINLGVG